MWPDDDELERVLKELAALPPLVFAGEARRLTASLAQVAEGRAFLLQAGDCAESFADFSADNIRDKLKVILQMAVVLTYGAGVPVVKVGRIAGQFAKPRSSPTERIGDLELDAFRGHMVNDDAPDAAARVPDPHRLVAAYHQSASTLNLVRAFTKGGFADLSQVHLWNQQFVASSDEGRRYEQIAAEIDRALRFMAACGIDLVGEESLHQVDFYTSHDALDPRLRGGAHPHGLAHRRLVRLLGAHALGGRAHAAARRRARGLPGGDPQPARVQDRRHHHAGRGGGAVRAPRPGPHPGTPDAHLPDGGGRHRRRPAAAARGRARTAGTPWCGRATPCTATPS